MFNFHNLIEFLRKESHSDNLKGHLIRIIVLILNSTVFQSIVTIVLPIIFSVLASSRGFSLDIIIAIIIYSLFIASFATINNYNKRRIADFPLFMHSTRLLSSISHTLAVKNLQLTKHLIDTAKNKKPPLGTLRRICSLQSAGFAVCDAVYTLFAESDTEPHLYVTLYQKTQFEGTGESCQMIAYANYQNEEPATYKIPYPLTQNVIPDQNSYFHNEIFQSGSTQIRALATSDEVRQKFKLHPQNEQRERKICQYVGIPVMIMGAGPVLLLQLDTDKPGFWGRTSEEIIERIENLVRPFVKMLELFYEHDRLVGTMHSMDWRD